MKQIMYLDDAKVFKLTNGKGHLGLPIPGATCKVTVGVRWSLPKKKHVPDDNVVVKAMYKIIRVSPNKYEVIVPEQFAERLFLHLLDKCGPYIERPKRKKQGRRRKLRVHKDSYLKFGLA